MQGLCQGEALGMGGEWYFNILNSASTENTVKGTFFAYWLPQVSVIPMLIEAGLTRQEDGGWRITDIGSPRVNINMQSLAAAEPELFKQLEMELNYRWWHYLTSLDRYMM